MALPPLVVAALAAGVLGSGIVNALPQPVQDVTHAPPECVLVKAEELVPLTTCTMEVGPGTHTAVAWMQGSVPGTIGSSVVARLPSGKKVYSGRCDYEVFLVGSSSSCESYMDFKYVQTESRGEAVLGYRLSVSLSLPNGGKLAVTIRHGPGVLWFDRW